MKKIFLLLLLCSSAFGSEGPFHYEKLSGSSEFVITDDAIQKWVPTLTALGEEAPFGRLFQMFAYLSVAERDAAFHSYDSKGSMMGSLDPLIVKIIQIFHPRFEAPSFVQTDAYSEELAQIIGTKFEELYAKGEASPWLSWYVSTYEVPPPPRSAEEEIKRFHLIRNNLSESVKIAGFDWENVAKPGGKNWLHIANEYMYRQGIDFVSQLQIRAHLMMGIYDAVCKSSKAKEHFTIPRPFMVDSNFEPLVAQKPTSMSYPSAHAAVAGAGEVVLTHFFPDHQEEWHRLAEECALSRIWVGVHFPMDVIAGLKLGREVVKEIYR